jgi:peroxiredoxin-like protein
LDSKECGRQAENMAHEYPVTLTWSGGRDGKGEIVLENGIKVPISIGKSLGGLGEGSNPEELLTTAVGACYVMTFGLVASNRKLPVESLSVQVSGTLEGALTDLKFTKILIRPKIRANSPTPEQRETIMQTAHKAEQLCIISRTLRGNVEIIVEPEIEEV